MARKVNKTGLENFQSALEEADNFQKTEFSIREVIQESFWQIEKARSLKVPWEQIAKILEDSTNGEIKVSPQTLKQYYSDLAKNPEQLPKQKSKKKGKRSPSNPESKPGIAEDKSKTAEEKNPEAQQGKSETNRPHIYGDDDIRSQFNLR